jgi:hypothetical protein
MSCGSADEPVDHVSMRAAGLSAPLQIIRPAPINDSHTSF